MARSYNGTNQRTTISVTVSSYPFSMFARCKQGTGQTGVGAGLSAFAQADQTYLLIADAPGTGARYRRSDGTSNGTATSAAVTLATWAARLAVANASADARTYTDTNKGTNATNVPNIGTQSPDILAVGAYAASSAWNYTPGEHCCLALWNATLTDDDAASLAAGFSPRRIKPQNLRLYLPMVRDNVNWFGSLGQFTDTGSPGVTSHPRSYGF